MNEKHIAFSLLVIILSVCVTPIPSASAFTTTATVDYLWAKEYKGKVTASRLDLSTFATNLVRKAFGSGYSASVYIEARLTYDFSFGLHTPYQVSMYLSNINPRVGQSATGYISLMPKNIYFDVYALSKLYLKIGAKIFKEILGRNVQITGGEYLFDKIDFSFNTRIDTEYMSPLGIYRVSVSELIKNVVGKILPKIELVIGLGAGAVFAIPIDWDLDLVFKSYVDVTSGINRIFSVSPTSMTFDKVGTLPFTITPHAGGQESVKWGFSQRISMGFDFFIKGKVIAEIAAGVATSYESPWYSIKVLSTDLFTLPTKTSPNILGAELSIPLPKLAVTLTSINSTVKETILKIFVNDETGASISGAKVEVSTRLKSYSANDLGDGYYSVTVSTPELSSIQISATKSGYEGILTEVDIGTEYLQEYGTLQATYNSLNQTYNVLQSEYDSLKSKHDALTSDLGTARNLSYLFVTMTIIFIATTVYLAIKKLKVKPELKTT